MEERERNRPGRLIAAAAAAFCTYFCMYAFRKPFTAGTFEGEVIFGAALKPALVTAQLAGYTLSKFIGIKVVSEMPPRRRALAIVGLIAFAESALLGFAFIESRPAKVFMLFLNGLPLGMVFGLVLAYLEGRRHTEALSAVLCASFIVSSGVVKSVGRWLVTELGVSEFAMPVLTGAIFIGPLLISVGFLRSTPPPDDRDRLLRSERGAMTGADRRGFIAEYLPGLSLLVFVYVALTVVRTLRDDFGVEIWRDMGVERPSVFAESETVVALAVTALNGFAFLIARNLAAIRATVVLMCASFGLVTISAIGQSAGWLSPFVFMVACGIGLYVPYVAFHTTLFERLVAASIRPSNLGFLMYVADAMGYLGYAVVMIVRSKLESQAAVLPFFRTTLHVTSILSILALLGALAYFVRALRGERPNEHETP